MFGIKNIRVILLGVCLLIGVFAALATRSIITGIGISFLIFISWEMWKYIQDISKDD